KGITNYSIVPRSPNCYAVMGRGFTVVPVNEFTGFKRDALSIISKSPQRWPDYVPNKPQIRMSVLHVYPIPLPTTVRAAFYCVALDQIIIPTRCGPRRAGRIAGRRCRPHVDALAVSIVDVVVAHCHMIHGACRAVNWTD